MRILHLPASIGGNAYGLSEGERKLGLDSRSLSFSSKYPADIKPSETGGRFGQVVSRLASFAKYRKGFDVYHFNFGSTLFHSLRVGANHLDLPLYPNEAVKVVTYQGCDLRQKDMTMRRRENSFAACHNMNCYGGVCNSGIRDKRRRTALEKMLSHVDYAFALNPDLMHFLPKARASFLPYTISNFDQIEPKVEKFFFDDKIRIVHAPTQREAKGTQHVISAIECLNQRYPGYFELVLVENMPYEEAKKVYRTADLVVDQLLIGWYGAFSVEVMKMGIPVMAYIHDDDLQFVPSDMVRALPIIRVSPETLLSSLIAIKKEREQLVELGKQSLNFVKRWHDPAVVAKLTKKVYQECVGYRESIT